MGTSMTSDAPLADALAVIDVSALVTQGAGDAKKPDDVNGPNGPNGFDDSRAGARLAAARAIGAACRSHGFFYVVGHGVDTALQSRLEDMSRTFFALPAAEKKKIEMARGGRAWRGYFPVGEELTSGQRDQKEGLYLGEELPTDHPLVRAGTPLHGPNLFPDAIPEMRPIVLRYLAAMTHLAHRLAEGIALSLGLEASYFAHRYTGDPLVLFRIFNYPDTAGTAAEANAWGVGEHTDYGFLTILKQDDSGGLQVKSQGRWLEAPPLPNAFVCNIGDMLDRITGGLYLSTPHRVRNVSGRGRLSFPFFFDPNLSSRVEMIAGLEGLRSSAAPRPSRWDAADVHAFQGTYGDYIRGKVSKVFPNLFEAVEQST